MSSGRLMTPDDHHAPGRLAEPLALLGPVLRGYRWQLLLVVAVGVAAGAAEGAGVGAVLILLSLLFGGGAGSGVIAQSPLAPIEAWLPPQLLDPAWVGIGLVLLIVLRLGLSAMHGYLSAALAARLGHETRSRLFHAIVNMPFEQAQAQSWGELYSIVDEHSNAVPDALDAVCNIIHALTVMTALGILLMVAAPIQAVIGLVGIAALTRAMRPLRKPVERAGEASVAASRVMSEVVIRTLHALRTFQILGLTDRQSRRFRVASGRSSQAQLKADGLALVAEPASQLAALLAVAVMALASGFLGLGAGSLLLAIGLLYRLEPYATMLQEGQFALAELTPALRLVDAIPSARASAEAGSLDGKVGTIRLRDVTFGYDSRDRPVLDRVNIVVPADGWTLVEGRSGAGKSTLVNLLLGLLEPASGEIRVGDTPLAAIERASWRRKVAVCGQDIELVSGSIRDNLLLGSGAGRAASLVAAIEATGLAPMIAELPDGLDTEVGERSLQLSGGQRQRLGIARAILRNPQVLILDEATSMLERAAQARILANLHRLMQGRTVIAIGHNLTDLPPIKARFTLSPHDAPANDTGSRASCG
jgi:ABC-type multidrug transport system fused ATPase/permease subunit